MKEERIIRIKEVFTFASGVAGAGLTQTKTLAYNAEILQIHQRNGNHTNPVTAQLKLEDEDSFEMWDGTAKAENGNYDFEFGVTVRRCLTGKDTLKCILSGDPGASGATITVVMRVLGRDG